ncbi:L-fucose/L-arabinose isomerase family protein [Clostridium sediminicola]|uniref:L-fucose/L-arabinose isomerase family protein n=1 Tax=Clostridium sediminicola TaxID=3114879 RepID=UPI0031F1D20B
MKKSVIKLGYCPTRRDVFSVSEAIKYKGEIKKVIENYDVDIIDLEGINEEGLLYDQKDLFKVIDRMKEANVDALFFPHCNFGTEDLVAEVGRALKVPVLVWGPRDDAPLENGFRTRDTQCGMFATGKVLRMYNVPFTFLTNTPLHSDDFKNGFEKFVAVANTVKKFKSTRILQISTRPTGFNSVMVNENELLEKFGIKLYPVALEEITSQIDGIIAEKSQAFVDEVKFVKENISKNTEINQIEKMIGLKIAIKRTAEGFNCNAAAIQCWNALQNVLGIMPCLANSLLADERFPCACETDIHGAISSILAQAAAMDEKAVFFADVTVRDSQRDNVELFWHCGPFPYSLAKDKNKSQASSHWILASGAYGTCEWEIQGGDITIVRFDGDHNNYQLLIGEGKGVEGPFTRGTYVWLEVGNWPKWEKKIVEGPYIHHVAGVHGKYGEILKEACKYINGLSADPVEPSAEELDERWLGR